MLLWPTDVITMGEWSFEDRGSNKMIGEWNTILNELKDNLTKARERMKKYIDQNIREFQFQVGDRVFLKMQPYKFRSLALKPNEKLNLRYYGLDKILEKIGAVAYRLLLPPIAKIHLIFRVSQLKKHVGPSTMTQ